MNEPIEGLLDNSACYVVWVGGGARIRAGGPL